MTGFYDFLGQVDEAGITYYDRGIRRMNQRYEHIVDPIAEELDGASVLDLGSHDGRWSYALAAAGATVTGIEGRGGLIRQYARYPDSDFKDRASFVEGDFVLEMDRFLAEGRRFDVVACLGVFYHTMEHYRLLNQMAAFRPRVIVIDSVFNLSTWPMITVRMEETEPHIAAISHHEGQTEVPVGRMSRSALELMAGSVGHTVAWVDWDDVPPEEREPVSDYYERPGNRLQRFTCLLRPASPV